MEQDLFSEIVELHFYKITLLKLNVHATRPKKGKTPPLWDGKSTERIVQILNYRL